MKGMVYIIYTTLPLINRDRNVTGASKKASGVLNLSKIFAILNIRFALTTFPQQDHLPYPGKLPERIPAIFPP
jgi:hypothetical protein